MTRYLSLIFRLAAPSILLSASAVGAVTVTHALSYKETMVSEGSEFSNSETAFQPDDTFLLSVTFDSEAIETRAGSLSWSAGLSGFSLTRTGGTGAWSPTGTFQSSNYVTLLGTSGVTAYGSSNDQPNLTDTATVFQLVEVNLVAGTIFRDLTTPGPLTLGERLGGPILPDLAASDVTFTFLTPQESRINVVFQLVPEPSSALLVCFIGLFALRRRR